jgi:hypothetical protein
MKKMKSRFLTKLKYLAGLQCIKYLWFLIHEPERIPEPDAATRHRFTEGYLIDRLAKSQFPDGININTDDFMTNINDTSNYLKAGKPLFEAGFMAGNLSARADILVPVKKAAWDLIEIKSSTEVKDVHVDDVAFQRFCYEKAGIKVRSCFLMHVNNKYIREGTIYPFKLLIREDITAQVKEKSPDMEATIAKIFKALEGNCPAIDIGSHCSSPYECPLKDDCWGFLPDDDVFSLYRGGKKSFELYKNGILSIRDIPGHIELTDRQAIQWYCARHATVHVDRQKISEFLNTLRYPLSFLDFETFGTAIPQYDHTHPYENIPFQFSLHIADAPDGKPLHHSFLAAGSADPRPDFLTALRTVVPDKGSVIVFNRQFEQSVLNALAKEFPAHRDWVDEVRARFVDLLIPFRDYHYYNPAQQGSASLKSVLPAITGKGYEGMAIADGMTASMDFIYVTFGELYGQHVSAEKAESIRRDLEKYCGLDTEGMVWIVRELGKLVVG